MPGQTSGPTHAQRQEAAQRVRAYSLLVLLCIASLGACGKADPGAADPRTGPLTTPEPEPESEPDLDNDRAVPPADAPAVTRVELEAEFHRTRLGPRGGFWVLGVVHNPHDGVITDVRARVRLLDAEGELVGEAEDPMVGSLAAGVRGAVAVLVSAPVEHELLELRASGVPREAPLLPPPALKLEYEPPQRAELGGWFVIGQVTNESGAAVEGVRLEILGLDRSGQLLGVDWLVLDPMEAREVVAFDVGELRYEAPPATFSIELRVSLSE